MSDLCYICQNLVKNSDKAVCCDHCNNWIHIKCNNLDNLDYEYLKTNNSDWFCKLCTAEILPFCSRSNKTDYRNMKHVKYDDDLLILLHQLNNFLSEEKSNDNNDSFLPNCKYRDIEYFSDLDKSLKNNSLSLLHLNVCSLSKNFDQLHNLLTQLNLELDFIGITETHLTSKAISPCNLSIENYIIEHTPTESLAGGALLYINKKHAYKLCNDLIIYCDSELESVFIEVILPKTSNLIVGCIYRHPNMNIESFNDNYLAPLLDKLSKESNKKIFLLGDFNIDLLKFDTSNKVSNFLDDLSSNFLPSSNSSSNSCLQWIKNTY